MKTTTATNRVNARYWCNCGNNRGKMGFYSSFCLQTAIFSGCNHCEVFAILISGCCYPHRAKQFSGTESSSAGIQRVSSSGEQPADKRREN
jgi:hypothetical protein